VRELAGELGLNANTIAAAYRELAAEGVVTMHRRGGTKVAPGVGFASAEDRQLQLLAERLIRFARGQHRSAGDVLRLISACWASSETGRFGEEGRYPIYDFLQRHEHDQA
jgi:DNA-binding transcriptional regulator YhcF (GntR family)